MKSVTARNLGSAITTGTLAGFFTAAIMFVPGISMVSFLYTSLELSLQAVYAVSPHFSSMLDSISGVFLLFTVGGAFLGLLNFLLLSPVFTVTRLLLKRDPGVGVVEAVHGGLTIFESTALYGLIWVGNIAHTFAPITFRFMGLIIVSSIVFGLFSAVVVYLVLRGLGRGFPGRVFVSLSGGILILTILVFMVGFIGRTMERRNVVDAPVQTEGSVPSEEFGRYPESGGLKLLVVGIDGIDWSIVNRLIDSGRLKNIDSVVSGGSIASIRSIVPNLSPIVWTSVATGRRPQKHGVFGFYNMDKGGEVLYNSHDVKVESIWDIISVSGGSSGVVNWYISWPVRPLNGFMVSDRFTFRGLPGRVYPPDYESVVDSILSEIPPQLPLIAPGTEAVLNRDIALMAVDSPEGKKARALRTLENSLHRDAGALESALKLYREHPTEMLAVYFRSTDVSSHLFWKERMAGRFPALAERLYSITPAMVDTSGEKMLIEAVYEWSDKALGRLMELASDSTIVCVLSDHGFGFKLPGQYSYDMNKLLSRLGLVAFDQTGGRVDLSRSSLFDCRVSTGIVNMVKKMQVVVNGKDTYNNEAERQLFLERGEELRNMLESLKTVRGENFFGKLDLVDEGDRVIITGMVKIGFLNQQVLVGGKAVPAEEFLTESDISGWHRNDGVFIISGPGIKHCRIERCSELDVAPTLLHILGLPVPLDMDGQVLKKVFAQRKLRNVEYCESYGIPAPSSAGFDLPEMGESVKDAIKEQLQALGYIQ